MRGAASGDFDFINNEIEAGQPFGAVPDGITDEWMAINDEIQKSTEETTGAMGEAWLGVGNNIFSAMGQLAAANAKGSALQKAFGIASIITSTATGIMKALEIYGPTPLGWAQAAAVGALGATQLSQIGGGGGGSSSVSGASAGGGELAARVSPGA